VLRSQARARRLRRREGRGIGELFLQPSSSLWRVSGEVCGTRVDGQSYETLQAAFAHAKREMQRIGGEVLAALKAEQAWTSSKPTPLQRDLLTNLLYEREAKKVDDRLAAQHLIQTLYKHEYGASDEAERIPAEDYTRRLMDRYHLDIDGVYDFLRAKASE